MIDGDKCDFSQMPALQPAYMLNSSQHNIGKVISELGNNVKGFLVEMPLDWGVGELKSPPPPPGGMSDSIAKVEITSPSNSGKVNRV